MRDKLLLTFTLILIGNIGHAQKKKYLQDSINIYQQIKVLKKTQKPNNGIFVFDNKNLSQQISKYISDKNEWKKINGDTPDKNFYSSKNLLEKLFYRDQNAIQRIIEILKTNDSEKINTLFKEHYSAPSYDYLQFGTINNSEVIDLLTSILYKTDDDFLQQKIIGLFCSFENTDYLKIVENFIISGKCKSELAAFVKLSIHFDVSKYEKTTDYIFNKAINDKGYAYKDYNSFLNAISFIFSQNNPSTRKKAMDYCFEYMSKNIHFPDSEINNFVKTNEPYYYQKYNFFEDSKGVKDLDFIIAMMKSEDKRIVPYIEQLNHLGIKNIQSDFILWKCGIDTSEQTFQRLVNDYDYFAKVLFVLDQRNILEADKKQLEYLFSAFENKISYKGYESGKSGMTRSTSDVFSAAKTLYQLNRTEFNTLLERHIKSNELKKAFYEYYDENNNRATFLYLKNKEQKKIKSINESSVYIQPEKLTQLTTFISSLKDNQMEIFDLYSYDTDYKIDLLESVLLNAKKYSKGDLTTMDFYTDYYGDNFNVSTNDNSIFVSFHQNTLYNEFIILNNKVYFIEMDKIKNNTEKTIAALLQTLLKSNASENSFVPITCCHSINGNAGKTLFSFGNFEKITEIKNKYGFAE